MHVPDSITVGPNRTTGRRLQQDDERVLARMEVPDTIRLGKLTTSKHRSLFLL
jgi:hypothetical protein